MSLDPDTRKRCQRTLRVVADHYKVNVEVLVAPKGTKYSSASQFHEPRRVAMLLMREEGKSFPQIGEFFNRDHSTAIYACRTAAEETSPIILTELRTRLAKADVDGVTEDCPSCRRLKLDLIALKVELLELRARMGCG